MITLTEKESRIVQKIKECVAQGEKITVRALQESLGYASPRSISVLLEKVMEKGWAYRDGTGNIRLILQNSEPENEVQYLPLIGNIACGTPIFAEENIITTIPISKTFLKKNFSYFLLRAEGDSMEKKGIHSGDIVLIQKTNTAQNGDIVVITLHDMATLKEFHQEGDTLYLIPHSHNPIHTPIVLHQDDENIFLQGIFLKCFPGNYFASETS